MNKQGGAYSNPTQVSQADGSGDAACRYECEWTAEADTEAGLNRRYENCKKNPGHKNFIPISQFSIEHLPPDYRDEDFVEWTKLAADLTAKVCVKYVSADRPETFPDTEEGREIPGYEAGKPYPFSEDRGRDDISRTGTAWVKSVERYKDPCPCKMYCPHTDWGDVHVYTACHVVFDDSEAQETVLSFHYDSENDRKKTRVERAARVFSSDTEKDTCDLLIYSHDVQFLERLQKALKRREVLREKLKKKYIEPEYDHSYVPRYDNLPVIIVSHPHGHSKTVTVGNLVEVQGERQDTTIWRVVYHYNADTCAGSSGALVLCANSECNPRVFSSVVHSASMRKGANGSAAVLTLMYN